VVAVEEVLSPWERCPERSAGRKGDSLLAPQPKTPRPHPRLMAGGPGTSGSNFPRRTACHQAQKLA